MRSHSWLAPVIGGMILCMGGCNRMRLGAGSSVSALGNSERGKQLIIEYGCGKCHVIPGVGGARGRVGPPLAGLAMRSIIAGELANTPENLTRWIRNPEGILPDTPMPDLHVTQDDANDVAAYLYQLGKGDEAALIN